MLHDTILTTAVKYVRISWFYGKLVYTALVLHKAFGVNLAVLQDLAKPDLQRDKYVRNGIREKNNIRKNYYQTDYIYIYLYI